MVKFKGYESKPPIDFKKLVKGTKIVTSKNISPRIKLERDLLYDHAPHGDPKGKWSRGELTGYENIQYGKWYRQDPARNSEITKRPTKMWKDYKPREYGYARFPTPVNQSNKKIVFLGCGPSSMGTIPWTMFSRPADYQMWVVEPRTQHPVFFPSKLYDIFYYNREEDQISVPHKLNQIIYPKGYGDIYWHHWPVVSIDPENRLLTLADGLTTSYEFLVINTGAQADWDKIENAKECLADELTGIFSLYYDREDERHHLKFKNALSSFKQGKILFYTPETKFSHPSTSASLVNLTYEKLVGRKARPEISHFSPVPYTVGDSFVDAKIREQWKEKGINAYDNEKLIRVDGMAKIAYFQSDKGRIREEEFDLLHITPPMSAASAVRNSPGLCDKEGWLDVDYHTFTHTKYPNIFGWGSGSNLPAPKTFFSSLSQINNGILAMSYLTACLEKKENFKRLRNRNDFYGGEGYDVVHLGNRMTAVVGSKDGKVSRYHHFPYVWEAWDSQYDLGKFVESFLEVAVRPDFYEPDDVCQLLHKIYPLEPSKEIVDEWNSL